MKAIVVSQAEFIRNLAESLYNAAVDEARKELASSDFDLGELAEIFEKLLKESETGQILIFASYLEDRMFQLLKARFKKINSAQGEEEVFGRFGPLSSLSSRILLAYHLGWMTRETKEKLEKFRKIRNQFAHNAFKISFEDERVESHFTFLRKDLESHVNRVVKAVKAATVGHPTFTIREYSELEHSERNLCALVLLASQVFRDLLYLPVATSLKISPGDISGDWDSADEKSKSNSRIQAIAMLNILARMK